MKIYTSVFKASPIEALHCKANEPPLKLRKNVLQLRFTYKLKSTPHIQSLVILQQVKEK